MAMPYANQTSERSMNLDELLENWLTLGLEVGFGVAAWHLQLAELWWPR